MLKPTLLEFYEYRAKVDNSITYTAFERMQEMHDLRERTNAQRIFNKAVERVRQWVADNNRLKTVEHLERCYRNS